MSTHFNRIKAALAKSSVWASLSPALVLLVIFTVYMANGRGWPSGDTVPGKLVPISLLVEKNLDMNEFEQSIWPGKRYCMRDVNGRKYSAYPLGPAFTALPVYAMEYLLDREVFGSGMRDFYDSPFGDERVTTASRLEKRSAAIIAALSAMFIWLICRQRLSIASSVLLTAGYAFGTALMSSASQALWTHGPSCLALTVMLYGLLKERAGRTLLVVTGAAAAWAVFCRPTDVVPILVLSPWVAWHCRWRASWIVLGGLVVFGATSALNVSVYGHFLGGYAGHKGMFGPFSGEALAGILFSPSRGLFVFSPFLALAAVLGTVAVVKRPADYAVGCLLAALATVILYAFWPDWGAGFSFGARLLCDVVPFLTIPLIVSFENVRRLNMLMALFLALLSISCLVNVRGAYRTNDDWNGQVYANQERSRLWLVRDSQWTWTVLGR